MTNDQTVTQADRDAADEHYPPHLWKKAARDDLAIAFARHRTAHSGEGREDVDYWNEVAQRLGHESVCEALEKLAELQDAGEGRSNGAGEDKHQFVQNPLMPFSSCQICLAPEDAHAALSAPQGAVERAWPAALTQELREILGYPNYQCGPMAHAYQAIDEYVGADGVELKKRAEDEQAFILHKLVGLWFRHGETWRAHAIAEIDRAAKAARAALAQPEAGGER